MPKGPLFSTYRQGENRVTASLMAVFERIDLSKVERILASASEDSALQLFSFENQVRGRSSSSVPDARISALGARPRSYQVTLAGPNRVGRPANEIEATPAAGSDRESQAARRGTA